ncbi:MAG: nucleotide exchange factor GrpE [Rickettsiales bacterium]
MEQEQKKEVPKKIKEILEKEKPLVNEHDDSKLLAEIAALKDQVVRMAAETDNLRKRNAKELEEANKYGITKFARDLIEVLENLHRAETSVSSELLEQDPALKQIFSGVELTKKSLIDAFEKWGIKRIDPMGEAFNHDFHQAITHVPSPTQPEGSVVQVIQAGYIIQDRLLRPALVAVAKKVD